MESILKGTKFEYVFTAEVIVELESPMDICCVDSEATKNMVVNHLIQNYEDYELDRLPHQTKVILTFN